MTLISDALSQAEINLREKGSEVLPYGSTVGETGDGGSAIFSFISTLLTAAAVIIGLLLFANLLYAGIQWLSSGGDSGKLEKARSRIMNAIVGFVIFVSVMSIFMLVQNLLNIEILRFEFSDSPTHTCCWDPGDMHRCVGYIGHGPAYGCPTDTSACASCN